MSLLVHKYGGSSLATSEKIGAVADRIASTHHLGCSLIVVVSAMGDTTDALIAQAEEVSENPCPREMDMLLSVGERISMALLSMALKDRKVPAISFTGSQSGILTDHHHGKAKIQSILGDRIRAALEANQIAIVAGFQGMSFSKEITTLGRGGSDTSAVALASAFQADCCEIFTDVDGVFSADPRWVPEAKRFSSISYEVMVEMALLGAQVLHPRSVQLAHQFQIPVRVAHAFDKGEGTWVRAESMEEFQVLGVTSDQEQGLVRIILKDAKWMALLGNEIQKAGLSMLALVFCEAEVQFFASRDCLSRWKDLLNRLSREGIVHQVEFLSEVIPVSLVGSRFSQNADLWNTVLSTLAEAGIPSYAGFVSTFSLSIGINLELEQKAVQVLHNRFLGGSL